MVPVIRIGEDTYERLKNWAIPLEDRPDDVIQRLLEIAESSGVDALASGHAHGQVTESGQEATIRDPGKQESSYVREQAKPIGHSGMDSGHLQTNNVERAERRPNERMAFDVPADFWGLHRKARGKTARDTYLRLIGLERAPRQGMFVRVSDNQWRLVEYSTLSDSTGRWWFGASYAAIAEKLNAGSLESIVFLCGEENRPIVTATLSAGRLKRVLHRVSKSREGQVKFNLRKRLGDRKFEIVISDVEGPEILG